MDIILNNPFRILGLSITASPKAIARRVSDMLIYTIMETPGEFDRDYLSCFSMRVRTPDTVESAARRIERSQSRLFYSLFWFWNNNAADERALIRLAKGDISGALSILEKSGLRQTISADTFSSLKNISVLHLIRAFTDQNIRTGNLYKGLYFSGKMFQSPYMTDYFKLIAGDRAPVNPRYLERSFVDEIFLYAERHISSASGLTSKSMLKYFQTFNDDIQRYVTGKIIHTPMRKIENEIEHSRAQRLENPADAVNTGKLLFKQTLNEMAELKSALSRPHIIYQITSDKLANEVLQCAIDAFNMSVKTGDPGRAAVKSLILIKCASSIAVGHRTRTRIFESFKAVKKWVEKKTEA